jgi:hypothetical protein
MLDIFETLYACGFILLFTFLMGFLLFMIGYLTPTDIIRDAIESSHYDMIFFPIISKATRIIGALLAFIGFFVAIFDSVLLNNGNMRGYSFISFGLMYLSFSFTMVQTYENGKFIQNIQKIVGLNANKPKTIENYKKIEKWLLTSRSILMVGCWVCIICVIQISYNLSDISKTLNFLEIIGIGFAIMMFAGVFELATIDYISHNQILKTMDPKH